MMLTLDAVAALYAVTPETVREWIRMGLPAFRVRQVTGRESHFVLGKWSGRKDSNLRPLEPHSSRPLLEPLN